MWNYPDSFESCPENFRSSGNTWTVLKVSGKLEIIWNYLDSFETVWKIKDYLEKNYSFETVWKFEITWKNWDSFETVPKTPNNLEISEFLCLLEISGILLNCLIFFKSFRNIWIGLKLSAKFHTVQTDPSLSGHS